MKLHIRNEGKDSIELFLEFDMDEEMKYGVQIKAKSNRLVRVISNNRSGLRDWLDANRQKVVDEY